MNISTIDSAKPTPEYVPESELFWTQKRQPQTRLKCCCFCISDWLIYFIATISLMVAIVIFVSAILVRPLIKSLKPVRVDRKFHFPHLKLPADQA